MGQGITHGNVLRKSRTMSSDYMSIKIASQLQKMKISPMVGLNLLQATYQNHLLPP